MSTDLLSQLAEYGAYHDARQGIVSVEDVVRRNAQTRPRHEPQRLTGDSSWRNARVAALAAVLVLIVVGGMVLLLGEDVGTTPVATQPPSPPTTLPPATTLLPATTLPAPVVTTTPPTTLASADPVFAAPIEGCTEEYAAWLSTRERNCDLVQGEEVPPVFGPLLDGGWFDLTELRGRPAVVLTWVASYGPGNRDALAEFQVLYDKWSDQIGFVSLSEDFAGVARQTVEAGGFTFPVVTCFSEPQAVGTNLLCGPNREEFLWVWWGNQDLPSWTVLDTDGRFVDIRLGGKTTIVDVDSLLASVVASHPDS